MRIVKSRLIDYCLYALISVTVIASMFIAIAWNMAPAEYMRWVALGGATLVIFGFLIGDNKILWSKKSFWITMCATLVVHCLVFAGLEIQRISFSGYKVMLICFVEICFIQVLKKLVVRT